MSLGVIKQKLFLQCTDLNLSSHAKAGCRMVGSEKIADPCITECCKVRS